MTGPTDLQRMYVSDDDRLRDELRALWAEQDEFDLEHDRDGITVRAGPFTAFFGVGDEGRGHYPEELGYATYEADDAAGYRLVEDIEVDAWAIPELPGALHKAAAQFDNPDPDKSALDQFKSLVL